jgi:hypothetical protein
MTRAKLTSLLLSTGVWLLLVPLGCAEPTRAPTPIGATASATTEKSPFTPPDIPEPTFAEKNYNVKDFGAVGDGKSNDTPAIDKAIEQCSNAGGGCVVIPAGTYQVASVHLKSNVRLQLDKDAVITGASKGYDDPEPNPYSKLQDFGHSHFHDAVMWGDGIENFAIVGGRVDGGHTSQGDKKGAGTGNKVIAIKNGKNLLFDGVTHDNGGHFVYLLNNCENITIENDTIKKSRDGIDLMGCRNVAIHDCHFTGCEDDTLGIKSDWALGKKLTSENIYAWDNYFESGCNGVQFGSETAGDFHNINVWNTKIGRAMKAGIGFTTCDGGVIDGVRFDHFDIKGAANPIFMLVNNRLRSGDPNRKTGTIKNVVISNVTITDMKGARQGPIHCATISGMPDSFMENIRLENIKITYPGGDETLYYGADDDGEKDFVPSTDGVPPYPKDYSPKSMGPRPASGFYIRNVKGLELHNVEISFEKPDPKPPFVVSNVDGLVLDEVSVDGKPIEVSQIKMDRVTGVTTRGGGNSKIPQSADASNAK